ncbi:MAG: YidC/Oxa1 family membrane protein insertase, partial [Spirochaetaceae bacterium]|nr:YidC/Oxa1 family membrane protein insertase [Spirochaetaceae bacterium]
MNALLSFFSTIVIYPVLCAVEFIFVFAHKLFKDPGFSVICLSAAASALCLPLYIAAEKQQGLERQAQKRLKPKIARIKAAFKGDERYMVLATYYRQNKYHPAYALRGAFSLFIQIPFFIAAYQFLSRLEILRGVPFLGIPDLGAPDGLLTVGGVAVNVLPLIMTGLNLASGAVYTKGFALKDKAQVFGTAAVFLALLYKAPSALALYWTGNNVFSLLKNGYIKMPFAGKRRALAGLFSCLSAALAAFCLIRYPDSPKAAPLAGMLLAAALCPWVFAACKKRLAAAAAPFACETGKTLPVFLLALSALWALLGLFLPSQLIASSPQEFSFIDGYTTPLFFISAAALQSFGLFVFWPVCLYFLFSRTVKNCLSLFFLSLALIAAANAFLFPG